MPSRRILAVLASNYQEFRRWCADSGLSSGDPEVKFIDRPDHLRGLSDPKIIRCRDAWKHPRIGEIEEVVDLIEQRRSVQVHVQPDPPHVAEAIRDVRRFGPPPHRR